MRTTEAHTWLCKMCDDNGVVVSEIVGPYVIGSRTYAGVADKATKIIVLCDLINRSNLYRVVTFAHEIGHIFGDQSMIGSCCANPDLPDDVKQTIIRDEIDAWVYADALLSKIGFPQRNLVARRKYYDATRCAQHMMK